MYKAVKGGEKIRKQIAITVITLLFGLLACTAVSAAESNDTSNPQIQTANITITGYVETCSNGDPFQGVTITAKKDSEILASTTTKEDGTYSLNFHSVDRVFNVTARYPDHNPSSKYVTVTQNSDETFYGTANFRLGVGDGDVYVYNGWATNPTQSITFSDGTTINGNQAGTYRTISNGVTNVQAGRTIYIWAGTYTGTNNRGITINKNLNIVGNGGTVTIDAGSSNRMFIINSGRTVTMSGLTFTRGSSTTGGAIQNAGTLNLNSCTFTNNRATGTGINTGGAIQNTGTLNINGCTFTSNNADDYGGAVYNANTGTVTVTNSNFNTNTGTDGGAIFSYGTLTVNGSTFTGNTVSDDGGAICSGHDTTVPTGVLTVTGSTFTNNSGSFGGAIWNHGTVNVARSNFTSNTATRYGGAIRNWGTATVTESNFTGNNAATNGDAISNYQGTITASFNRFIGNDVNDINVEYNGATSSVVAENNWWGSNTGPTAARFTVAQYATGDANPWLILSITAVPDSIRKLGTSGLTGFLTRNSNGVDTSSLGHVPDGIRMDFAFVNLGVALGSVSPLITNTVNGLQTSTFTAANTNGVARVSATVDGVTVYTDIIIGDQTDLAVTNTIDYDDSIVYLKDTGIFYITVRNNGPDDATGVKVTLSIPAGFQVLAINPHVGTYDTGTNTWTIGNLSNKGIAYLDLILKVITSNTSLTTTATVSGIQEDPNMSNNVASKTATIQPSADIAVTQTVSNLTPNTGTPITITITATNNGPLAANNVVVFYRPPTGLNAVVTPSAGTTYDSGTGQWTIGTLGNGNSATLTITATVTAASGTIIKNTAKCIQMDEIDNDNTNNQNTANIRVGGVSYTPSTWLRLEQYLYNPGYPHDPKTQYDTAMFYVDLRNYGPDDATGVNVAVTIPAGYTILAINPKQGTYNTGTNMWNLGNLCNGEWAYLDIVLKAITANTALTTNTTVTQNEINPNPTKSSPATINIQPASNIQVNQTVSNTHPTSGSTITYTITVTNNGPQAATIVINDLLSAALAFVSYTSTTGTYSSTTGDWTVTNLGAGATATLTITANVNSGLPIGTIIKNNATLTSLTGTDPNQTDISKITTIQTQ